MKRHLLLQSSFLMFVGLFSPLGNSLWDPGYRKEKKRRKRKEKGKEKRKAREKDTPSPDISLIDTEISFNGEKALVHIAIAEIALSISRPLAPGGISPLTNSIYYWLYNFQLSPSFHAVGPVPVQHSLFPVSPGSSRGNDEKLFSIFLNNHLH